MGRLLYSALIGLSVPAVFPGPYTCSISPHCPLLPSCRSTSIVLLFSSSCHHSPFRIPPLRAGPGASPVATVPILCCPSCPFHRPHTGVPPLIFPCRCPCKYRRPHLYRVPFGPRSRVPGPRPVHVRPGVSKQALPPVPPSRLIIARLRRYVPLWPFPAPCGRCPHSRSPAVRAVPLFSLHVLLHAFSSRALSARHRNSLMNVQ